MDFKWLLAKDKKMHIAACAVAAVLSVVLAVLGQRVGLWAAALAGGTAVAVGYELLQKYRGEGEPSWKDAVAGIVGAVVVSLLAFVFNG